MKYVKALAKIENILKKHEEKLCFNKKSLSISSFAILEYLKEYEVGIPLQFYDKNNNDCVLNWLLDEEKKGHVAYAFSDNTYKYNGQVLTDFAFMQFDSLVEDAIFVMITFNNGMPNYLKNDILTQEMAEPILLKINEEDSFYDILDQISLESTNIPSKTIKVNNLHYLIIPRIACEDCFVFCKEDDEELYGLGSTIEEIQESLKRKKLTKSR